MGLPYLWFIFFFFLWFIFFFFLVLSLDFFEPLREIFGERVLSQVGIKLPFE